MKVVIYGDFLSQPFRSLLSFLKINNIDHEIKEVHISALEQRTKEYRKISPLMKIPAVEIIDSEESFKMFESVAIMKYLVRRCQLRQIQYPQNDYEKCLEIDKCLDFHHSILRPTVMFLVKNHLLAALVGLKTPEDYSLTKALKQVENTIITFQKLFLNESNKYLAGSDQMTIADISSYQEIVQLLTVEEVLFYKQPQFQRLQRWIIEVSKQPQIKEVMKHLNMMIQSNNEQAYNWLNQNHKL